MSLRTMYLYYSYIKKGYARGHKKHSLPRRAGGNESTTTVLSKKQINNRQKRKLAYRARHRLHSIDRDSKSLKERVFCALATDAYYSVNAINWPWVPNKHCGSWYLPHSSTFPPVYFKSTDGHIGTYAISLKRLNLSLLELLHRREGHGCFLVDSSVRKVLPDSFSRTIPIWACVLNRIVQKFRREISLLEDDNLADVSDWDIKLVIAMMPSPW